MKILHFLSHSLPLIAGYTIRSHYILKFQKQLGYESIGITRPEFAETYEYGTGKKLKSIENIDGVKYHHFVPKDYWSLNFIKSLPRIRGRGRFAFYLRNWLTPKYYRSIVEKYFPDCIIHAHISRDHHRYAYPLAKHYGIPFIYEIRGVPEDSKVVNGHIQPGSKEYFDFRNGETEAALAADLVVTISEGLKRDFVSRGVSESKIYVVPNGVDIKKFTPVSRNRKLVEKYDLVNKTVIGYISSIRKLEGIEYLIRSIPYILQEKKQIACLIVGDGDDFSRLEKLTHDLQLENVIFTEKISHNKINEFYSLIDIFVIPRIDARVNQIVTPLKPLEAMAMEKALLVSNVGGLTEIVQNQKTGLTFQAENPKDLAGRVLQLIDNEVLRIKLGKQARDWVLKERDWQIVVKKYQEIYNRAIELAGLRNAKKS